ncbi:Trans-L-3-hydroxyproline dehydratase [Colletotrichum chlorophyti]|uniref:trans-L-3-hydroxyproline dehydratase n=1 Tax=Colletotrichum chlorophyti TaxID=708187 RepID=A0A1Q8RCZ7_9PEZI|nr:Trans-L-3-hydroxyproline dehydratase [Colletotrichum chlorophyti]
MSLAPFIRPLVGSFDVRAVEMHTSGEPARIVYAGFPELPGTLLEQRALAQSRYDQIRRSIIYEPRGHQDMYGAILRPLTELVDSGEAHMGALFLTHEGYGVMCGHATIALGRFLVDCTDEGVFPRRRDLKFDDDKQQVEVRLHAPVGLVRITVPVVKVNGDWRTDTKRLITFLSVPTFATAVNLTVPIPQSLRWLELGDFETVKVDIGFGGAFYAVVPAWTLGFSASLIKPDIHGLSNAAKRLKEALNASSDLRALFTHPGDKSPGYLYGVMITDTESDDTVPIAPGCSGSETGLYFFGDQQIDRSPTGSLVQARVALAIAKGHRRLGESWTYHSLVSKAAGGYKSAFVGTPVEEVDVGGTKGVRVHVSGQAYYTGSSTFVIEEQDDIGKGFSFQSLAA